ncbi:ABC transporter permease [Mycoplasmopsis fermentans]|uniref:ABC transporter permease n=1 Tax=Mycoplasmopsis fermentans TaxID=2115 RepID=UPI000F021FE5|nr:ABC transporter permease [Mycoplasmopsis fermentans]RMX35715.1 putative membrane protein [Mycoplasmopsis fermentans MF-I1]RMX35719.1 putative membrane protein [Mycoplasmopsis fermentans MF-I2]
MQRNRIENKKYHYSWLFDIYVNSKNESYKKLKRWVKVTFILLILIICLYSLLSFDWKIMDNNSVKQLKNDLQRLFTFNNINSSYPANNLWILSLSFLWSTIQYTALGSLLGFLLALVTSYLASWNLHKNKILPIISKIIITLLRTLPIFFFVFLFTSSFDRLLSASLILTWFTWLWLHKYLCELWENSKVNFYWNSILLGQNKFASFINNVSYRNKNKVIVLFLYSFESNIRWSSVLSTLGLFGIGELINNPLKSGNYSVIAIPLLYLALILLILEIYSLIINHLIFNPLKLEINNKTKCLARVKLYLIISFSLIFLTSVITLINIKYQFNLDIFKSRWSELTYKANYSILKSESYSIFKELLITIKITIASIFLAFIFSIFASFFANDKTNNKFVKIISKMLLAFFRTIPITLFFYLSINLYYSREVILILALSFTTMRSMSKFYTESINNIDQKLIDNYLLLNKNKITLYFEFILPRVIKDFYSYAAFRFELIFRNIINYGAFAAVGLGDRLNYYQNKNEWQKVGALILIFWLCLISIELITTLIKYRKNIIVWLKFKIKKPKLVRL